MARSESKRISIIGDGAWGTTLGLLLRNNGFDVKIWCHDAEYAEQVNREKENRLYLPGFDVSGIYFTGSLEEACLHSDVLILAVPSRFAGPLVRKMSRRGFAMNKRWCIATKGLDQRALKTFSSLVKERLSAKAIAVISGPAIAREVAKGLPTAVVCAGRPVSFAVFLRNAFSSNVFRVYSSNDLKGVELGGALKNVIAIAAGMCDGLGLGVNAKSALVTRGLAEISRLAVALGAKKKTLYGTSGVGDLMTTCFSPLSRNRSFGQAIAEGRPPEALLQEDNRAIEGAHTVKAVIKLSKNLGIDMPISRQVYNIIFRNSNIDTAIKKLLSRPLKHED